MLGRLLYKTVDEVDSIHWYITCLTSRAESQLHPLSHQEHLTLAFTSNIVQTSLCLVSFRLSQHATFIFVRQSVIHQNIAWYVELMMSQKEVNSSCQIIHNKNGQTEI